MNWNVIKITLLFRCFTLDPVRLVRTERIRASAIRNRVRVAFTGHCVVLIPVRLVRTERKRMLALHNGGCIAVTKFITRNSVP